MAGRLSVQAAITSSVRAPQGPLTDLCNFSASALLISIGLSRPARRLDSSLPLKGLEGDGAAIQGTPRTKAAQGNSELVVWRAAFSRGCNKIARFKAVDWERKESQATSQGGEIAQFADAGCKAFTLLPGTLYDFSVEPVNAWNRGDVDGVERLKGVTYPYMTPTASD